MNDKQSINTTNNGQFDRLEICVENSEIRITELDELWVDYKYC